MPGQIIAFPEWAEVKSYIPHTYTMSVDPETAPIKVIHTDGTVTYHASFSATYTEPVYKDLTHDRFKWNSYGMSIDYLLNFTNLIMGFRENRKFHLQGIVGIGGSVSRNYTTSDLVSAIADIRQDPDYNSHEHQF